MSLADHRSGIRTATTALPARRLGRQRIALTAAVLAMGIAGGGTYTAVPATTRGMSQIGSAAIGISGELLASRQGAQGLSARQE